MGERGKEMKCPKHHKRDLVIIGIAGNIYGICSICGVGTIYRIKHKTRGENGESKSLRPKSNKFSDLPDEVKKAISSIDVHSEKNFIKISIQNTL